MAITDFLEKTQEPGLSMAGKTRPRRLASMGVYVFSADFPLCPRLERRSSARGIEP